MPPVTTSRLVGPALAGAAAVFAGGVWLLPQRVFTPDVGTTNQVAAPAPAKPAYVPPAKETRWPELASKLEALREPWKGPDTVVATNPEQPQAQPEVMLSWEYVGLVNAGQFRAAIVVVNNLQRFVSVGEAVSDPSFPGATLRIKAIEDDKLEVEHESAGSGGNANPRTSTVQRKKPQPPALTAAAPGAEGLNPKHAMPGTPGLTPTPGLTSGGGRGLMNVPPPHGKQKPVNPPPGTAFPVNPPGGGAAAPPMPGRTYPSSPFARPVQPSVSPGAQAPAPPQPSASPPQPVPQSPG